MEAGKLTLNVGLYYCIKTSPLKRQEAIFYFTSQSQEQRIIKHLNNKTS